MNQDSGTSGGQVLVVDDDQAMCEMVQTALTLRGHTVTWVRSADEAMEQLGRTDFDAIVTDVKMPGTSGLQLCSQLGELRPDLPVVVMTGFGSMDMAVTAIRAGAYDFITKPFDIDLLNITVDRAIEHGRLKTQLRRLEDGREGPSGFGEMIGESQSMRNLYDQLSRISQSDASILITGESGTGKEVVARAIHQHSARRDKPFIAVNCAALSETLLESELFGHAQGAFTDARTQRRGLLMQANGGTLLLDEMGDMPMALQVKLLRALEERKLRPVGSDQELEFDVRILSATHRDLETAVEEHQFREDLYYRINVIQIHLPPLRARGMDILLLAQHFVQQFAQRSGKSVQGIAEPAAEKLLNYSWPGNIRELRNVIERAVALTVFDRVGVEDLPDKIREHRGKTVFIGGDDPNELMSLEEIQRRYINHVLESVDHNKTLAAQILGVDRKTLYRKLKAENE
ncbi:sigma-54-dependent Fis family transcriptional regulator [Roseiconus nitratireducens]|uniref:Sigma-54-dependent Fis family transcriptional regulator n=1 Tax=Roseiconus nitratireducens TaxID=2605748 RepID=A0A5M6D533_9BACT|nr:sigma-54 dependent transcriptional regulator [Roseiconus nitratireducens]KAA5542628.1 sigma-54-dependent Fis family transcriptional regulator [Roseiconus nitratireducens]